MMVSVKRRMLASSTLPIWLQIHKLPDEYCKKEIVVKLLKDSGKILDMRLNGNTRGDYVRVRVRHDVCLPLTKFVSHEFKECGTGVHETKKHAIWGLALCRRT